MTEMFKKFPLIENRPVLDAVKWRLLGTASIAVTRFLFAMVLARLLTPLDYGLLNYAMIYLGFASIISDLGLRPAIVQRSELGEQHLITGFFLSFTLGCLMSLLLYRASFFFSDVLSAQVFRFMSILPAVTSLGVVQSAVLERYLDFKNLQAMEFISLCFGSGIAVVLAFMGYGVWSLVYSAITGAAVYSLMCIFRWGIPSFNLPRLKETGDLLSFGMGNTLARIANYFSIKADNFVISLNFPFEALGGYNMAFAIASLPSIQFTTVVTGVLFPAFARIQFDSQSLRKKYLLSLQLTALLFFPFFACFGVLMPEFFALILGRQWLDYIQPAQVLCFASLFGVLYTLTDCLVRARGAVYRQSLVHAVIGTMVFVSTALGSMFGLNGVAGAVSFSLFVKHILLANLARNEIGIKWSEFFLAHVSGLLLGSLIGLGSVIIAFYCRINCFPVAITCLLVISCSLVITYVTIRFMPSSLIGEELYNCLLMAIQMIPIGAVRNLLSAGIKR